MKNIEDDNPTYSLQQLKISNDIAHKWATHFKFSVNRYLENMIDVYNNKNKYTRILNSKKRKQFNEEYKKMFYALEVENNILKQYYYTILCTIRRIKVPFNLQDHYMEVGLNTLRAAIWNYKTHSCDVKFITYCMKCLQMRLQGERIKIHIHKNRKKRVGEILAIDLIKEDNKNTVFENLNSIIENLDVNNNINHANNLYQKIIDNSNLKEDEFFLLKAFMERDRLNTNWVKIYKNKYPTTGKNGNTMSRQGISNKLISIQQKLFYVLIKVTGGKFDILKFPFAKSQRFLREEKRSK